MFADGIQTIWLVGLIWIEVITLTCLEFLSVFLGLAESVYER
jgi:hypothetical protein